MDILTRSMINIRATFEDMTPQKLIRIVIIVGGYVLLRPYLMKLAGRAQMHQHEKESDSSADADTAAKAKISPNTLRGRVQIPDDSDEEEGDEVGESAAATASDWGKKARKRQRAVVKGLLDAEEKRLAQMQEDEEDKDIEEFLEE